MIRTADTRLAALPRGTLFTMLGITGRPGSLPVDVAGSLRRRLRGWLGRSRAPDSRGLWIPACDAVHTLGMRFPIDLLFIDAGGRVLRVDRAVRPWRVRVCLGAYSVVELAAGEAGRLGIACGDFLERRVP